MLLLKKIREDERRKREENSKDKNLKSPKSMREREELVNVWY